MDLAAIRFTPDARLIAFQPGYRADAIVVHQVATGRTISVPMPRDVALARLVRVTGTDPEPLQPLARPVPAPRPGHDLGFDGHPWFPLAIGTLTAVRTARAPLGDRGHPWRHTRRSRLRGTAKDPSPSR